MTGADLTMSLLHDGVPLCLLIDLAGLGSPSEELYRDESPAYTVQGWVAAR